MAFRRLRSRLSTYLYDHGWLAESTKVPVFQNTMKRCNVLRSRFTCHHLFCLLTLEFRNFGTQFFTGNFTTQRPSPILGIVKWPSITSKLPDQAAQKFSHQLSPGHRQRLVIADVSALSYAEEPFQTMAIISLRPAHPNESRPASRIVDFWAQQYDRAYRAPCPAY